MHPTNKRNNILNDFHFQADNQINLSADQNVTIL